MIKKIKAANIRKSRFFKIAGVYCLGIIGGGSYLAGGAIRTLIDKDEEVADFDIFFEDKYPEGAARFENIPLDDGIFSRNKLIPPPRAVDVREILEQEKFQLVFECPKGELYTYKKDNIKIQLILAVLGKPADVINNFDFGATAAAFDGEYVYFSDMFMRDVKKKVLSIQNITYPAATIKRMSKYEKKGYNIGAACVSFMEHVAGKTFGEEELRLYVD